MVQRVADGLQPREDRKCLKRKRPSLEKRPEETTALDMAVGGTRNEDVAMNETQVCRMCRWGQKVGSGTF
jgi:hypothetical protein